MTYNIIESMNYGDLVDLFIRAGLEINPGEPAPEGLLSCFEVLNEKKERVGAAGVTITEQEYVLRFVAVEEEYRGKKLGRALVDTAVGYVKGRGAKRILLTAKVPGFYKKLGFHVIPRETAPAISDCQNCWQFHNGCDSEIMCLNL